MFRCCCICRVSVVRYTIISAGVIVAKLGVLILQFLPTCFTLSISLLAIFLESIESRVREVIKRDDSGIF